MKFLHISDLHLGIKLMDIDLIEDQRLILNKIVMVAKENEVDGVLIAGDVYDISVPRIEATALLDDFLTMLCDNDIKVFMISGNHDQAERLSFGSKIMKKSNIYISEKYNKEQKPIVLKDEFGDINIYMLPFIKPINVRTEFSIDDNISYDEAIKIAIDNFDIDFTKRNILLAHQFITGGQVCDSENIQVGGTDQVNSKYFEKFDYVALGHLHTPQIVAKKEYIRYSGSPIKLSFSEAKVDKLCYLLNVNEKGKIDIEEIKLKPLKDMAVIKGSYTEIIEDKEKIEKYKDVYLKIELTDNTDIPFVKEKLGVKYKNIMQVVYTKYNKKNKNNKNNEINIDEIMNKKSDIDLIKDFFKEQTGKELLKEQEDFVKEALDEEENE